MLKPAARAVQQGVLAHRIAQRFGEYLQIETADVIPAQPAFHRPRMTHVGERAGDNDPIPTPQCADDLVSIALGQQFLVQPSAGADIGSDMPPDLTTNSWFRLCRVRGYIGTTTVQTWGMGHGTGLCQMPGALRNGDTNGS